LVVEADAVAGQIEDLVADTVRGLLVERADVVGEPRPVSGTVLTLRMGLF